MDRIAQVNWILMKRGRGQKKKGQCPDVRIEVNRYHIIHPFKNIHFSNYSYHQRKWFMQCK